MCSSPSGVNTLGLVNYPSSSALRPNQHLSLRKRGLSSKGQISLNDNPLMLKGDRDERRKIKKNGEASWGGLSLYPSQEPLVVVNGATVVLAQGPLVSSNTECYGRQHATLALGFSVRSIKGRFVTSFNFNQGKQKFKKPYLPLGLPKHFLAEIF